MVPIVSIVGLSGSGKTTLMEKVVSILAKKGYRVGTVKHDAHYFEIDYEGKDSWRHRKAGASTVALSSPDKFAVIKEVRKEWTPERIINSFINDVDIVITEGYKAGKFKKIEVVRKVVSGKPVNSPKTGLIALVTDIKTIKTALPVFDINDAGGVARFIEERIIKPHRPGTVALTVDGKPAKLSAAAQEMIMKEVAGMARGVKGAAKAKEIELRIRKR